MSDRCILKSQTALLIYIFEMLFNNQTFQISEKDKKNSNLEIWGFVESNVTHWNTKITIYIYGQCEQTPAPTMSVTKCVSLPHF